MTTNALQCVLFSCCRNDAADGYAAGLQASGNDHKIDVFRAFRTNMLEKRAECMEPRSLWPEVAETIMDPAIPYQGGSIHILHYGMKFGLATDEMSNIESILRAIERLDKKYRVVNVSNNKHRFTDLITLHNKCCHEISVLWMNRMPFWPEISAISFSKDLCEFEGIAVLSARVYQIGSRLDCDHYLEKIDSYQIKCINEAGRLCYGLMSPHSDYGHRFCRSEAAQREVITAFESCYVARREEYRSRKIKDTFVPFYLRGRKLYDLQHRIVMNSSPESMLINLQLSAPELQH